MLFWLLPSFVYFSVDVAKTAAQCDTANETLETLTELAAHLEVSSSASSSLGEMWRVNECWFRYADRIPDKSLLDQRQAGCFRPSRLE